MRFRSLGFLFIDSIRLKLGAGNNELPEFVFEETEGAVTGVSFVYTAECEGTGHISSCILQRIISVYALAGAQNRALSDVKELQAFAERIADYPYQSFSSQIGEYHIECQVELEGCQSDNDGALLIFEDGSGNGSMTLHFAVRRKLS